MPPGTAWQHTLGIAHIEAPHCVDMEPPPLPDELPDEPLPLEEPPPLDELLLEDPAPLDELLPLEE